MVDKRNSNDLTLFPLWFALGIGIVGAVIYLTLTAKPPQLMNFAFSDKLGHFLAYAVLMGWFGQLFRRKMHLFWFVVGFCLLGVSLEFLQGMGRHRHFEYADMIANAVGVLLGLLLTTTVFKGAFLWFEQRLLSGRIKT